MEQIADMANFIRSRQRKGITATEVRKVLTERGYDLHAARALVMMHWVISE